jgi:DNA-binding CsgD family transcriptional regulator
MTPELLSELIGLIYEAATDDAVWPVLLERIARAFNAGVTQLMIISPDTFQVPETWIVNAVPGTDDEYREYVPLDRMVPGMLRMKGALGAPVRCTDFVGVEDRRLDRYYNEFLKRHDVEWRLGYKLAYTEADRAILGIMRPDTQDDFEAGDLDLCRLIIPHLQRSLLMRAHSGRLQVTHQTTLSTLSLLPSALLMLDENGQVVFANAAADELMRRNVGVSISGGRLRLADADANRKLQACLPGRRSGTATHPGPTGGVFPARGWHDGGLSVLVAPAKQPQELSLAGAPCVVVMIHDRTMQRTATAAILKSLYGLTSAEGRLLEGLLAGHSLQDLADRWGLSRDTLKAQLTQIFAKTGTSRQAELLRVVQGNLVATVAGRHLTEAG